MNIKNYTSSVPAAQSIQRIETKLMQLGATDINKKIENFQVMSIQFAINIDQRKVLFDLPARVDEIFRFMWEKVKTKTESAKERTWQQAERTAWKIISDWVDIQITMIILRQAEILQIFLPYAQVSPNKSLYSAITENGFKMLTQ